MMVRCGECVGNVLLITNAIPAVLGLTVYGIAGDTEYGFLLHQWHIVATSTVSGGHGGGHRMRAGVAGVDAVVLIDQRLVPMFLGPECACHIRATPQDIATLVVEA